MLKAKITNVRSANADGTLKLAPVRKMTLESTLEYELVKGSNLRHLARIQQPIEIFSRALPSCTLPVQGQGKARFSIDKGFR